MAVVLRLAARHAAARCVGGYARSAARLLGPALARLTASDPAGEWAALRRDEGALAA
jgi:hypothetical protein